MQAIRKTGEFHRSVSRISMAAFVSAALGGCSTVGVKSIDLGRTPYNQVIEQTSQQQALLNIIRTVYHEPPLFMDVTEVDQATTVNGSISGGPSAIGAYANPNPTANAGSFSGTVGAITGTAGYSEAPTVRYLPLAGQALIAQVSTPITPESLANLIGSDWPIASVLTLGVDHLTPNYSDYDAAVNAIAELDQYGAIIVTATTKPQKSAPIITQRLEISAPQPESKDNLTVYFHPQGISVSQSQCDTGRYIQHDTQRQIEANKIVNTMWRRLISIYYPDYSGAVLPDFITIPSKGTAGVLKNVAVGARVVTPHAPSSASILGQMVEAPQAPMLVTRSALGVLKMAAEQDGTPTIEIKTDAEVRGIVKPYNQFRSHNCDNRFYEVLSERSKPTTNDTGPFPSQEYKNSLDKLDGLILDRNRSLYTLDLTKTQADFELRQSEKVIANQRRFMLIAHGSQLPADAAVGAYHGGEWYYILQDDDISKRTLALITQFNTIQALPTPTPPLTPTISVGAR